MTLFVGSLSFFRVASTFVIDAPTSEPVPSTSDYVALDVQIASSDFWGRFVHEIARRDHSIVRSLTLFVPSPSLRTIEAKVFAGAIPDSRRRVDFFLPDAFANLSTECFRHPCALIDPSSARSSGPTRSHVPVEDSPAVHSTCVSADAPSPVAPSGNSFRNEFASRRAPPDLLSLVSSGPPPKGGSHNVAEGRIFHLRAEATRIGGRPAYVPPEGGNYRSELGAAVAGGLEGGGHRFGGFARVKRKGGDAEAPPPSRVPNSDSSRKPEAGSRRYSTSSRVNASSGSTKYSISRSSSSSSGDGGGGGGGSSAGIRTCR